MLYLKAVHILFVMSWMACIFYLPRIFVHYAEGQSAGEDVRRLVIMARKLYGFSNVMAVLAIGSGIALWLAFGFAGGWLHAKIFFVGLMLAYHFSMRALLKRMVHGATMPSSKALRWYNEMPLLLLVVILWLVVLKPF